MCGWTEIGEHDAGVDLYRVRALAYVAQQRGVGGLSWSLQQLPVRREQPAVVAAPQSRVLALAVLQRCAAVCATPVEQAVRTAEAAKQDQILAQHSDRQGDIGDLRLQGDRMPEAAQILAAG